jgi:hypothetical protein
VAAGREHRDAFTERHLWKLLRAFQNVEVTVAPDGGGATATVYVHTPYMMQSVSIIEDEAAFATLKARHQDRLRRVKAARDAAPREVRAFLQRQFYASDGSERTLAKGRASPEDVRVFLQEAADRGLVSPGEGRLHPDASDLRGWLRRYGVGVDCSGFVQHALNSLLAACHAAAGWTDGAQEAVGFVRAGWVYRQASADPAERDSRFRSVATPAEARPGDVLVSPGHIRIVIAAVTGAAAGAGGGLVLDLAESISARGVPSGLAAEEADIGPRLIQVRYPEPERPVGEQTPLRRCPGEGAFQAAVEEKRYVFGRYRELDRSPATTALGGAQG